MSLVGFKAQNHRQQVGKRGAKPDVSTSAASSRSSMRGRSAERNEGQRYIG